MRPKPRCSRCNTELKETMYISYPFKKALKCITCPYCDSPSAPPTGSPRSDDPLRAHFASAKCSNCDSRFPPDLAYCAICREPCDPCPLPPEFDYAEVRRFDFGWHLFDQGHFSPKEVDDVQ